MSRKKRPRDADQHAPDSPRHGESHGVWRERSDHAHHAEVERRVRTPSGGTSVWRPATARGRWTLLVALLLAAVSVWLAARAAFPGLLGAVTLPDPRETARVHGSDRAQFVGAERCQECHAAEYAAWAGSTHGHAGGEPGAGTVIAPFDGRPIRFANAIVTPRVSGTQWEFVVAEQGEPAQTFRVDGVIGGGHMEGGGTQGFVTTLSDGTRRFLPFDWSRQGKVWFCNTNSRAGRGWVPISTALRLQDCGDWPPVRVLGDLPRYANCQSCHASQLTVALDTVRSRWDTRLTSLAINCESCHGAGKRHVEIMTRHEGSPTTDIGYRALATLEKEAATAVCYQCHAVKDQLREGFLQGDSLAAWYSIRFPLLGDRQLHADGRVRSFAYQEGQLYSACYLRGGMTCTSCHDPHSQHYRDVARAPLPGRFDDRQCTSCHASKAGAAAAIHSHHGAGSSGSRCTACHMPYLQHPETEQSAGDSVLRPPGKVPFVRYARSDHTIPVPRPLADSALGVRGACAQCHTNKSVSELDRQLSSWWGEIKPLPAAVAAQLRFTPSMTAAEAAPLLLGADSGGLESRHPMARFAGIARYLETFVTPDAGSVDGNAVRRLRDAATDTDTDVRAVALASLHLARGEEPGVRRTLASALQAEGAHDASLRARWSLALGFMGDRFSSRGDFGSAVTSYRRALEVTPGAARVLLALANAQRDGGNAREAIGTYRLSVAADARVPIAWVNLGITLLATGDTASALDALNRATQLDSGEPLAWFNLANVHLMRGDLDGAQQFYDRAARLDPGLAVTHLRLARVWLLRKNLPAALRELRRGLSFDSSDAMARQTAVALTKALGGKE